MPLQAQLVARPEEPAEFAVLRLPVDAPLYLRVWTDGYGAPEGRLHDCAPQRTPSP